MPAYGFLPQSLRWHQLRHALETYFVPEPPYGAVSYRRRTTGVVVANSGRDVTMLANASVDSEYVSNGNNAIEFKILALPTAGLMSLGFRNVANSALNTTDATSHYSGGRVSSDGYTGQSYPSPAWSVGDVIGFAGQLVYRNGVRIAIGSVDPTAPTDPSVVFVIGQESGSTGNARVAIETKREHMLYDAAYQAGVDGYVAGYSGTPVVLIDWPLTPVFAEPLATAITITPSSPTGTTGSASPTLTVAANGRLVGTINVTVATTSGTLSASTFALTDSARSGTFTTTRATDGSSTISTTNDGGLSNASITYTSSTSSVTETAMTNNTSMSFSGTSGVPLYYYLDVPASQGNLLVEGLSTSGGAHFDVYYRFNAIPTTTTYDRTFDVSGKATVDDNVTTPNAGRWHIMIMPLATFSGGNIKGYYTPIETALTNGVSTSFGGTSGVEQNFYLDIPSGQSVLLVSGSSSGSGVTFNVYYKIGGFPTTTSYDRTFGVVAGATNSSGGNQFSPPAGRCHVLVVPSATFASGGSVKAQYTP